MKQAPQTEFEKLTWKEICMRLLHCVGREGDDWFHKHWHDYNIDKHHADIILNQYEEWTKQNNITVKKMDYSK